MQDDSFDTVAAGADGDERAYGSEVDWWSFGVVLFEVILLLLCLIASSC